jgi:hypothetical protein
MSQGSILQAMVILIGWMICIFNRIMMHLNQRSVIRIVLVGIIMLFLVFPTVVKTAIAQTTPNYYITVNSTTPNSPMYTTVGRNWTVSFEALWSYGDNSGQAISNATVTVQVNNSKNEVINTLSVNTTTGLFSFNHSLSTADVLTFTPVKLVTQDGVEWKPSLLDAEKSLYGFQSESVVVWWDTFHVSLVSYDTKTLGVTAVSVNVTYLLLPEDGLTLPEWATYSNQTFLPKIVHNANVTINGVKAGETSMEGIFTANTTIWLPTAYIHVEVSKEGWVSTHTGFSYANQPLWDYGLGFGLVLIVALTVFFVLNRKSRNNVFSVKKSYAFLGGVLLAITSVISLYWGLVGLDSTLHGFDWVLLTIMGLVSFGFGLLASILSVKRQNQPLVIMALIVPILTNLTVVSSSLGMYQFANPWLILIPSFVLSFIGGVLICNADEAFT